MNMALTDHVETPTMDNVDGNSNEAEARGNEGQGEWHWGTRRLQKGEEVTFFIAAIHEVGFLAEQQVGSIHI